MIWNRLKNKKCPHCNHSLINSSFEMLQCCICPFKIKKNRFDEILTDLYRSKSEYNKEDKQEELNNL